MSNCVQPPERDCCFCAVYDNNQKCSQVATGCCPLLSLTVLADANFPSASICKHGPEIVRADGKINTQHHSWCVAILVPIVTISE